MSPRLILLSAILLPGSGQVWNGQPFRGLTFLFFMALFGTLTLVTAPEGASTTGKLSGALFIWALSIPDAYRTARLRQALRAAPRSR